MKISNQNQNYSIYQQKPKNPTFKGYFAAPIKELHIQPYSQDKNVVPFIKELQKKCGKYFDIVIQMGDKVTKNTEELVTNNFGYIQSHIFTKWGQDNKLFFENGKLGVLEYADLMSHGKQLGKALQMEVERIGAKIEGGNVFLGKKKNGESFALIGEYAMTDSNKTTMAKLLHVKPKNLHVISQPDFHIDMGIRPLAYPYVLVGDSKLTTNIVRGKIKEEDINLLNNARDKYSKDNSYSSADKMTEELKVHGFKPIRVPGLAGKESANFMNAIVHQNEDGSLVYITNKPSKTFSKNIGIHFEDIFKEYLQKEVPEIKEVIFIEGNEYIPFCLTKKGGIHCLTSENPDFELWNRMLNK